MLSGVKLLDISEGVIHSVLLKLLATGRDYFLRQMLLAKEMKLNSNHIIICNNFLEQEPALSA